MNPPRVPRTFSTSARVHPSFMPRLSLLASNRLRWIPVAVASSMFATGTVYAASSYRQHRIEQDAEREAQEAQRRRQHESLMDVYGDRSSLEELERAVKYYEKKP
ncbi:hypothetical protein CDD82_4192 [Ophiocordyceps australis]|uniref:Uncharacterized protein n=1 Tax=Ophiocordyceps australis TaxID=1399860 RepID=A0A2C5Z4Q8_9HYPO|nr:hypothetical protein CDD82_4192 [Ophiocordyceps australis]